MYENKVRSVRQQKGMTLLHLSELSGISVGYLCHLEKGSRNNPSLEVMEKIAKALDKKVSEIFFI